MGTVKVLLVLIAFVLLACSGAPAPAAAPTSSANASAQGAKKAADQPAEAAPRQRLEGESREALIAGPQGGELRSADDRLRLTIPGGLSLRGIRFKVTGIAAGSLPSPAGYLVIGGGYDLTAEEEGRGAPVRFTRPVRLQFTVRTADLPVGLEPGQLTIARHDGGDWSPVPSSFDSATGVLSAEVDHFSPHAAVASSSAARAAPSAPTSASPARVTPTVRPNVSPTVPRTGAPAATPALTVATPTIVSSADATTALSAWAKSVLSLTLTPNPASGFSTSASGTIPPWLLEQLNLSGAVSSATTAAVSAAGTAYGGLLSNGAILLAIGSGNVTGDVTVDVQTASYGYSGLRVSGAFPVDANAALTLGKQTYPGVANRSYTSASSQSGTYLFKASGTRTVATRSGPVVVAEAIALGVSRLNNAPFVYVAVGTGSFANMLR